MTWNVRKLISPPFQCISLTNRVLSLIDCFTTYSNCMTWNFKNLISPSFQCTKITNRVLSLFDRFTTYYNCMTWNFKKLISPPFQFTKLVFLPYLRFYTSYNFQSENSYHHFSAQVSQIVFLAYLIVLRLITTVWPKMSQNSYNFIPQVQSVFLAYLTVLRITTVWPEM